ncbi:hypothetical protein P4234_27720 [Pseudomonas aeruginosa]|nr:hypothetical protein [Pseudomonas aeruginosa]
MRRSERHGQAPLAVWFDDQRSGGVEEVPSLAPMSRRWSTCSTCRTARRAVPSSSRWTCRYCDPRLPRRQQADWLAAAGGWRRVPRRAFLRHAGAWGMSVHW